MRGNRAALDRTPRSGAHGPMHRLDQTDLLQSERGCGAYHTDIIGYDAGSLRLLWAPFCMQGVFTGLMTPAFDRGAILKQLVD